MKDYKYHALSGEICDCSVYIKVFQNIEKFGEIKVQIEKQLTVRKIKKRLCDNGYEGNIIIDKNKVNEIVEQFHELYENKKSTGTLVELTQQI